MLTASFIITGVFARVSLRLILVTDSFNDYDQIKIRISLILKWFKLLSTQSKSLRITTILPNQVS